ncbi:hypothetical protein GEMRC1_012371 [Eukaryota sp. GEM-RC1]
MHIEDFRSSIAVLNTRVTTLQTLLSPFFKISKDALDIAFGGNYLASINSVTRPNELLILLSKSVLLLFFSSNSDIELSVNSLRWGNFRSLLTSMDKFKDRLINFDVSHIPSESIRQVASLFSKFGVIFDYNTNGEDATPTTPYRSFKKPQKLFQCVLKI